MLYISIQLLRYVVFVHVTAFSVNTFRFPYKKKKKSPKALYAFGTTYHKIILFLHFFVFPLCVENMLIYSFSFT